MRSTILLSVTVSILISLWISEADSSGCKAWGGKDSGMIRSPNYPSSYSHGQYCSWTLSVEEGNFIVLVFQDPFQLETDDDCRFDSVEVIDIDLRLGREVNSRKFCGLVRPDPLLSTTSTVKVKFKSDGTNEFKGFQINWSKTGGQCNRYIDYEDEGSRRDRGGPNTHTDPSDCSWTFVAPRGRFIHLLFSLSPKNSAEKQADACAGDTIEVFDGLGNTSIVSRGKWSGLFRSQRVTSFGSKLVVHLQRDSVSRATPCTFTFTWKMNKDCGGVISDKSHYLMSYNYPDNVGAVFYLTEPRDCVWNILIPAHHYIVLEFNNPMSERGCEDLEILDYSKDKADFTPRPDWCIPRVPRQEVTLRGSDVENTAEIKLVYQNGANGGRGFYATWRKECGGTLTGTKGNVVPPGNDGTYSSNQDCEWTILGVQGHLLRLDFRSSFEIESSMDGLCSYDYVDVTLFNKDGPNTTSTTQRFCGSQPPPRFTSTFPEIVVRFHSDGNKEGKGFWATWDSTCGAEYTSHRGNVTSPNFPETYPRDADCRWEIRAPESHVIKLTFNEPFALEGNSHCDADYLEIYDYTSNGTVSNTSRWCGQATPPQHTSVTSRMTLVFHSDGNKNYKGFQAEWEFEHVLTSDCGGILQADNGTFTSPGFPNLYPGNSTCRWEIQATQGQRVRLEFGSTFDLEMNKDCAYDGVEVIDILPNGKQMSLGKWCGVGVVPVLYSTSSRLVVLFYSDLDKGGVGFSASWLSEMSCGNTFSGKVGHLLSPNYPSPYPEQRQCRWEISPPLGTLVDGTANFTLRFDSLFDLEATHDCSYDFVEIHRGNEVLGRWCGTTPPPDVTSLGQTVLVIFHSDKSVTGKGFYASFN